MLHFVHSGRMMSFAVLSFFLTSRVALGQQDDRAASRQEVLPLGMAENSVDDQYLGCTEEVSHLVEDNYLKLELNRSADFSYVWRKGEHFNPCNNPGNNLTRNHCIALSVYTYVFKPWVYATLNAATFAGKGNYINKTYQWYSLHFLLTDAIQRLNKIQITNDKCRLTYRGTNKTFERDVTLREIRFGSFTSSSLNRSVTVEFGNVSCFKIWTCHGAYIKKYSFFPDQEEVLIPPYETFKVTKVLNRTAIPSLWCDTVYVLKSTGVKSNLQCALVKQRNYGGNMQCQLGKQKNYVCHLHP